MSEEKKTRNFSFINKTANPLGGKCYGCTYCYIHGIKGMKNRFPHLKKKYSGEIRLYPEVLKRKYKDVDTVFFCNCIDWLQEDVPIEYISEILEWIEKSPKTLFLSLTKNPNRYLEFGSRLPVNMWLGATIESNLNYPSYSKAPLQRERINIMIDIANSHDLFDHIRMLSIEPILDFDSRYIDDIINIIHKGLKFHRGCFVVIGYDNYNYRLTEPRLEKTNELIRMLRAIGVVVITKTIRKGWFEE